MLSFIYSPRFRIFRLTQFVIAMAVFFYAGLSTLDNNSLAKSPLSLHILGNILLISSLWVAFFDKLSLVKLIAAAFVISFSCEFAQSLTPTRQTDPFDFLCNAIGILTGAGLCFIAQRWLEGIKNNA